jgi:glycosyltransferase involved in cell wall biosynthesis
VTNPKDTHQTGPRAGIQQGPISGDCKREFDDEATKTSEGHSLAIAAPSAYLLGGVQAWLDYLVPGLDSAGWEVTLLLVHGAHSDAHRYLEHHPFPRVHLVTNGSGSREGRVRALGNAIRSSGAGLVLGVNIVDVYEAIARLRRRNGGSPKVAMALHGLNPAFYDDIARWRQSIDAVIATNRLGVAAAVRFGGLPDHRVLYAPCGVVVPDRPRREAPSNELTLLYAGRFADEKRVLDLPLILRALGQRKVPCRLRLAGSGPSERDLRAALAEFGPKVEFCGVLDPAQMRESFLRPGAVALILSPSETGPLVAWEAHANGVAVVTSRFSGIGLEGSLRDGETCLTFPVGAAEAAASAIARLVDPALRRTLVEAGYSLVKERYSREVSIHAWRRALEHVLSQPALTGQPGRVRAPVSGRLDRYIGPTVADSLRRLIGLRFQHSEPGGEWPHSYGSDTNERFRRELNALDESGL